MRITRINRLNGLRMLVREKNDEKRYAKNGMLNKPGYYSTGSFAYKINVPMYEIEVDGPFLSAGYSEAEFFINGCGSDHVTIECDIDDEDQMDNSLHKIDTLIAGLLDFRKDLIEARELMAKRNKEAEELRKKKKDEENKSGDSSGLLK